MRWERRWRYYLLLADMDRPLLNHPQLPWGAGVVNREGEGEEVGQGV